MVKSAEVDLYHQKVDLVILKKRIGSVRTDRSFVHLQVLCQTSNEILEMEERKIKDFISSLR